MAEPIGERVVAVETRVNTIEGSLNSHLADCAAARKETNERMLRIERIIWIATGVGLALSALLQYLLKAH